MACDKLLEKLTGETFDRRKDVWALAACVCEFVAKDTRIFKIGLLTGEGMEIRAANADSADAQHDFILCHFRFRDIKGLEMTGFPATNRFHGKQDVA